jgi:hypothetical protein
VTERQKIEERLRRKQAEARSLEEKLRGAKAYIAALQDVLKIFDPEHDDGGETKLKAGSAVAQAREFIRQRGEPMHLDDILRALGKEVTRDNKASLTSSIAAYSRRGEIFVRTAPNTYGLIELGHDPVHESEPEPVEPPPTFGGTERPAFDTDLDDDVPF